MGKERSLEVTCQDFTVICSLSVVLQRKNQNQISRSKKICVVSKKADVS